MKESRDPGQVRPFLRWAGSKRKLLPTLVPYWGQGFGRYVEPFAGSAALFFALEPASAVLGDINRDLIQTLTVVRDNPEGMYQQVRAYPLGKRSYNALRALQPNSLTPIERAARFLFLNRFCFNGLYRTNEDGHFNVPYSPHGTGSLPSREQLLIAAALLRRAELRSGDFETMLRETVSAGDFVYLDPPYAVSNRRVFCQYGPHSFGLGDLLRLSDTLEEIERRGAHFVLSYADCAEARNAFSGWKIRRVFTQRNISGFAKHRRRAAELIVSNLSHPVS
jgi:DNA adenine methylase